MNYTPHTEEEVKQMLEDLGVKSLDGLFSGIPDGLKPRSFNIPSGKSEAEILNHLKLLASKNSSSLINFVGAGFYDHYIPAAVDAITSLPEFYTAYTPYQPETSQGWLQAIYEYQTAICHLTDMDVSNASLYDGGTALYEACMMAMRINGRKKIVVDEGVNLIYWTMIQCYISNLSLDIVKIPVKEFRVDRDKLLSSLDDKTSAVVLQNPNFFGCIDDYSDIVEYAHKKGIIVIESVYPVSLGVLKTPGEMNVDITVGEGQSLGNPLSFGGPYLGFIATKKEYVRKMPGRIVGRTIDRRGRDCYVLTLQAREQHIRREKATSNICSNEALCALRSVVYLSLLGKHGLTELAQLNMDKAEFARQQLEKIPNIQVFKEQPVFNEFPILLPERADFVVNKMIDKGYAPGFPLGRYYRGMEQHLLVAITEQRTKEDIVKFAESMEAVLCS
ncbi:MAG: aminomethyl-transferring glycine dehydrogenase subunit GcvPA [Elusimicrobia bacterium]|jgi:glycine dehydrogenase subunit 1|nr:aminomethyl-transferring glycine dehydrogenase subunit GcvPA [Elusimicrobiota bacterium]